MLNRRRNGLATPLQGATVTAGAACSKKGLLMAHRLLRKPTHGNTQRENAQAQQALNQNQYAASIYVGRRKVWEGRGSTEQEAYSKARAEKTKYAGANPEIKVAKVKASQR